MPDTKNDNTIVWEREVIEKLLLEKKSRKSRKWLWIISLFVLIRIFIYVYSALFANPHDSQDQQHIATLTLSGLISDYSETLNKISQGLKDIYANHDHVKAIIIKANSPGGSPVISDIAYQEIKYYKAKYPDIPIYTVVDDMCASGCYYIISATDAIYANPSSIVGSIGVIMLNYDLTGLADKLGIKDRTKTAGRNKAIGNPLQTETAEQKKILNSILDKMHVQFISSVKVGRANKLKWNENSDVFTGRIYTGAEAKDIGLIDDFGNIYSIARNIMSNPVVIDYTPEKDWLSYMKKSMGAGIKSFLFDSIETSTTSFR